jgi:hypothetical protein
MEMGVSQSNRRSKSNAPQIRSYAELQEQLHRDLLTQYPEWIDSDGNCPRCAEYDRRLAKVIAIFQSANEQPANKTAKAAMTTAIAT